MKLITFESSGGVLRLGALGADSESRIVDLAAGAAALGAGDSSSLSSMLALIEAGPAGLALARDVVSAAGRHSSAPWAAIGAASVKWRSPLPVPPQLRDCLMFEEHLLNSYARLRQTLAAQQPDPAAALADFEARGVYRVPPVWYEQPLYYKANRFSFIGTDEDIVWPEYTEKLDFELEYACVLNSRTKDVTVEEAENPHFRLYDLQRRQRTRRAGGRNAGTIGPLQGQGFRHRQHPRSVHRHRGRGRSGRFGDDRPGEWRTMVPREFRIRLLELS